MYPTVLASITKYLLAVVLVYFGVAGKVAGFALEGEGS